MKKVYDKINIDLYIIAVAFGKNYSNNVYARILISDNKEAKCSQYSRPIDFYDIYDKEGVLEEALFSQKIPSINNVPLFRKVVSLEDAIYWGKGNLIHISHATIGIKNNSGSITKIRDSFTAALDSENEEIVINDELYSLFNRKGALYYKNKEFIDDYKQYIAIERYW